jgi:enolase
MGKFWLMTKRDGPLRETIPDIISVYNQLREQMQSKADARKAEGSEGEQQQAEVGAPAAGGAIADEEGFFFAPEAESVGEVLGYMEAAATAAGKAWGDDVTVCCNMGAHAYFLPNTLEVGTYCYKPEGEEEGAPAIEADGWADWVCAFLDANPAVAAIEDVAANEDYETWRKVRLAVEGREQQVVVLGDAIYRDDADLYRSGVAEGWAAGAVMRPAVLGTLTELLDNATMFTTIKPKALRLVLAHRAGERAGEAEADVAVGIGAWGIKCAAPSHATVRKLSRLICIEEELDKMKQAAEEGNAEAQLAHLVSWQQVGWGVGRPRAPGRDGGCVCVCVCVRACVGDAGGCWACLVVGLLCVHECDKSRQVDKT